MRDFDTKIQIHKERDYPVKKANEIIQKAKVDLTLTEQKIFLFAVSKIKPDDTELKEYEFGINEFCDVCGINRNSGSTIENVKNSVISLKRKPFWMLNENGEYETIDWIAKAKVNPQSGKIKFKFDETMHKYLIDLQGNYTQYSLLCMLPMRSAYSLKLYELLRSYAGLKKKTFDIDDLKEKLFAPYINFKDFRKKVLDIATREINEYTDIEITWEPINKGRKVTQVEFTIHKIGPFDRYENAHKANLVLDGQLCLNQDGTLTEFKRKKVKD